jgi:hypothetical protein
VLGRGLAHTRQNPGAYEEQAQGALRFALSNRAAFFQLGTDTNKALKFLPQDNTLFDSSTAALLSG